MSEVTLWAIFVVVGIGTFLIRLSFIQLHGRGMLRLDKYGKILQLLAPAVLAALSIPTILLQDRGSDDVLNLSALAAAAVTAGLAWRFRGVFWPLCLGMLTFWGMRYTGF